MTHKEAIQEFTKYVKPAVIAVYGLRDVPALREAWNNYTDELCKSGQITSRQYETWLCPRELR
jgi:hypothetical protein